MENSYAQANPNVFPCVNCGQCQDACSMEIHLARLTFMLNRELADIFKYEPGMDVNAPIPLKSVTDKEINCGWCWNPVLSKMDQEETEIKKELIRELAALLQRKYGND